jgi:hypothetical protein
VLLANAAGVAGIAFDTLRESLGHTAKCIITLLRSQPSGYAPVIPSSLQDGQATHEASPGELLLP